MQSNLPMTIAHSNVNLDSHLSALLFLGSSALLLLLLVGMMIFAIWRRPWQRHTVNSVAVLVVGYGILLLGFSLFSREHTLARGEEKYFCELDCHLAYSVQNVERARTIGDVTASGEFYIVTLRTRFDENTIASWRPRDVPLTPAPLTIAIVDAQGRTIEPSAPAQAAWQANHGNAHSVLDPLRPGESYETTWIFDVPTEARSPRLLAWFGAFPTQVLIGDESSVLHKKTYFLL
jgi:hypothetical protein